ncbi:spore coat protein YutH, partial [Bacillus cereus]|nr:spore coat protein YutH [Bacillus cereus]
DVIQYVVDTEMADTAQQVDTAIICQERFTALLCHQTKVLIVPFDWVYAHPTRDMADLISYIMIDKKKDSEQKIIQFVT